APAMKKLLAVVALCLCAAVPWLQDTASQDKPAAPPTLEALLKQLDHKDVEVRVQAMMELAEFGPKAAPALKRLLAALEERDEDLRLNAALALGKIGKEAVTPLAGLLKSADEEVRFYAVWAIGGIGSDASGAVPQVIR